MVYVYHMTEIEIFVGHLNANRPTIPMMDFLQAESPWRVAFLFLFGVSGTGLLGIAVMLIRELNDIRRNNIGADERRKREADAAASELLAAKSAQRIAEADRVAAEAIHRSLNRTARLLHKHYGFNPVDGIRSGEK